MAGLTPGPGSTKSANFIRRNVRAEWRELGNALKSTVGDDKHLQQQMDTLASLKGRFPVTRRSAVRKRSLPARPMNQSEAVLAAEMRCPRAQLPEEVPLREYERRLASVSE